MLIKPRKYQLGTKNIIGHKVTELREKHKMKQKELLAKMQTYGVDINPSSLSKLEGQTRPVTDIEVKAIAEIFSVSSDMLLDID